MATTLLLVDLDSEERSVYATALTAVASPVYTAATFAQGKTALSEARPDVLVTQARLAEFNGIHLALWGRMRLPSLRSVIIGQSDPNLEPDARASGFFYLRHNDEQAIVQGTLEAMARENPRRRWRRKSVGSSVAAQIDGTPALVLDAGYGGCRLQTQTPFSAEPESGFVLEIPAFGVRADAACRWMRAGASDSYWWGASLGDADIRAGSAWRALVDAMPV
jgi:hypothetical protein